MATTVPPTAAAAAAASEQWLAVARAASRLLGWSYTLCWGISFYPQLIINFRRKSVTGLALDFFVLNVLGFACYSVSTVLFLFSPAVRSEYAQRHPQSPEPTVRWNDLAFAAHALAISIVSLSQFFLWGYQRLSSQRLSAATSVFIVGSFAAIAVSIAKVDGESWQWLDVTYTLATIKLLITLIKYIPQAVLNYRLKSTVGWSIHNILLDLSGGILSLSQLLIDTSLQNDWSGLAGNPAKLFLALIAIAFDCVFVVQHYVLYPEHRKRSDETSALLSDDDAYGEGAREQGTYV